MIYEMARDLGERLAARKFPYRVHYGPERLNRQHFRPVIVIQRDRTSGDSVGAPLGFQQNPRRGSMRMLAVEARIYAESTLPGAHVGDHERECEAVVDALITAVREWATSTKHQPIEWGEARYVEAKDMGDVEVWPGVAYRLRFRIGRGVEARDYEGQGQPTSGALSGFSSHTTVYYKGQPDSGATGCGEDP